MAERKKKWLGQLIVVLALIAAAVGVAVALFVNNPEKVEEKVPVAPRPTLVETVTARTSDMPGTITAYGVVQPSHELTIQAEVGGRVIEVSDDLDVGGLVKEGQILLKIDPRNYLTDVEQEKSSVQRAEFELQVEQGKELIAKKEWELLEPSVKTSEIGKELALRQPHVKQKTAALSAAKSKLEKALLDLKRTVLLAPFDAMVTAEFVEVGQLISSQTKVATLVGSDQFRVQVAIPYEQLHWVQMPTATNKGSKVTVIQELASGQTVVRKAELLHLLASLDSEGKMARLLVVIDDPLGLKNSSFSTTPLLIGGKVKVEIEARNLKTAVALPRAALRDGNHVWVMNESGKLEVRNVMVTSQSRDVVAVAGGVAPGDKVIVSALPVHSEGMELRTISTITHE